MSGYVELWADYRKRTTSTGMTASRVFLQKAGGSANLPEIGDALPGTSACLLREIEEQNFHWESESNQKVSKKKYTCTYSTQESGAVTVFPTDEDARTFQASSMSVEAWRGGWYWESTETQNSSQMVRLDIPSGTFTRSKVFTSDAAKKTWIQVALPTALGKINANKWEDFREGSVKFIGVSGSNSRIDMTGNRTWVFELTFEWRLLSDVLLNDWMYVTRSGLETLGTNVVWDRLYKLVDGAKVYYPGLCDFDEVLFK